MAEYLVKLSNQKKLHKSVEDTGVIYVDWIFLFLWLREGRENFRERWGPELRPERLTEEIGEKRER